MNAETVIELNKRRLAQRFLDLFNPAPHAHGAYITQGTPTPGQKFTGEALTVDGPASVEDVENHLAGRVRLGFLPLHQDDTCYFGAIDIDVYKNGGVDLKKLAAKVARQKLPLIPCRTKSGGAHLYVFYSTPQPREELREKLADWGSALGYSSFEIFPKQSGALNDETATGNWINVPYFLDTTWAVDENGERLTLEQFLAAAERVRNLAAAPPKAEEVVGEFDLDMAASALLEHWTSDRHLLALQVSGALIRSGVEEEKVRELINRVGTEAHDEELDDRIACVGIAAKAIASGARMYGVPALRERLGAEATGQFLAACGISPAALGEMNERYAVINWKGRTLILQQPRDPNTGWREVILQGIGDFKAWTRNTPRVGKRSRADWWLDHPARRQYDGVVFAPDGREVPGYLNLWGGWAVQPAAGDCSAWLEMVLTCICSGDQQLYNYVIAWCADAVQHTADRPGITLVLQGIEGTGKGTFARTIGSFFGEHFLHIRHTRHLTGNFNAHLVRALLVFADEAVYAGDKQGEGALRGLITEPTIPIEYKGKDVIQVTNHVRVIMATNSDWAIHAHWADRRFCMIEVSDAHANDSEYFGRIRAQMESGGTAALLHYLRQYDLSGVNLRKIPDTKAKRDQQQQSMDPFREYWFDRLCLTDGWETDLRVDEAMAEYRKNAGRHPLHPTAFGVQARRLFPTLHKARLRDPASGVRERVYQLPELPEARAAFEKFVGRKINWEEFEQRDIAPYSV